MASLPVAVSSDDDSNDAGHVVWIDENDLSEDEKTSLGEYWNAVHAALDSEWRHSFGYTVDDFEGTQIGGYRVEWGAEQLYTLAIAGELPTGDDLYQEI